jgi:hypothetical protein
MVCHAHGFAWACEGFAIKQRRMAACQLGQTWNRMEQFGTAKIGVMFDGGEDVDNTTRLNRPFRGEPAA